MNFDAVILAGGKSSRMGRDKAFLEINGQPLLLRQIEIVRAAGAGEILISGRVGRDYSRFGLRVVQDERPEAGPLAGIHAAMSVVRGSRLLVLAVDLPAMNTEFLRNLAAAAAGGGVVPRIAGQVEPLAAIYPCSAREIAGARLRDKNHGVCDFAHICVMAGLAIYADFPAQIGALFKNVNSPPDLA